MSHSKGVEPRSQGCEPEGNRGDRRLIERRVESDGDGRHGVNDWTYWPRQMQGSKRAVRRTTRGLMPPSTPHAF
jgi:hypothetical protein